MAQLEAAVKEQRREVSAAYDPAGTAETVFSPAKYLFAFWRLCAQGR